MKISTRGTYALELAVELAISREASQPESIKSIAAKRHLSEKYLERIVGMLRKAGIVESTRGAKGGYVLTKEPGEIYVWDILQAAEGDLAPVECLTKETDCGIPCDSCPTRSTWNEMWNLIRNVVQNITLEELKNNVIKSL